jgi:hypothetical protein
LSGHSTRFVRAAIHATLAGALLSCQRAPEAAVAPRTVETPRPPTSAPSAARASRTTPVVPASPAPSLELSGGESRVANGRSTRGVIPCGSSSCTPGKQACASMSKWTCVASDAVPDVGEVYFCDDGTDCPAGETCCQNWVTAQKSYSCTKRRGPESECRLEICAESGARCPKGQACVEGACRAPHRTATCDKVGRCPSSRPICVWSQKGAHCATWEEFDTEMAVIESAALRCTERGDCGPEARCCTNSLWNATQCLTNCDAANNGDVCTSSADCTTLAGKPMQGNCVPVRDDIQTLPAWLKVCSFE